MFSFDIGDHLLLLTTMVSFVIMFLSFELQLSHMFNCGEGFKKTELL
ncbi:hypothetical protein Pint_18812 [Pistacia integerrima]|uniref:Uncharacterized protein n=1 Tax=Pistacia integerrima TaxID=434235 RepID=A0ACC0YXA3_9ROSI|nr:hypothetical protein Pint_18812 [Pistacia integerrima]